MRFIFTIICFVSSISMAAIPDFNQAIEQSSIQEKRLHRKLLQSIQQTQVAIAYSDRAEQLQNHEANIRANFEVRLMSAERAKE